MRTDSSFLPSRAIRRAFVEYGSWAAVSMKRLNHSHAMRYRCRQPYRRMFRSDVRCILKLRHWFKVRLNRYRRVRLLNRLHDGQPQAANPMGIKFAALRQRRRVAKRRAMWRIGR